MGLKVIVVGAGIGGLTSAAALRRAGCDVQIFEKSAFIGQIGAALSIASNGARVLSRLGFSYSRASACTISTWETLSGQTMEVLRSVDLSSSEKMFGEPARTVHRVDLHNELLRIATNPDIEGGSPVKLHLSSEVVAATSDGTITLRDGSIYSADVVIGADGLRSAIRDVVLSDKIPPQSGHAGLAAFRFLVDSEELNMEPSLKPLLVKHQGRAVAIMDTTRTEEHHIMWYPCRGGTVQNFVGIHPSKTQQTWDGEAAKIEMRREYAHYHEDIDHILRLADHVKCWPLFIPDPYPTWVRGRVVLIGDAAHPVGVANQPGRFT
ncbi:hypothetical protein TMatcc_008162 [Talaromyces marneffei ATCC 18224]|uniref:3-hydroxybenzoate 6-hydroxylase 1 n=1 Tax=Talaromyces marneffei PM1 TaxID=1077442 RepID=A0A093UNS6_TALMA